MKIVGRMAFVIHGLCMGGAEKFLIGLMNHFCSLGYQPILITLSHDNVLYNELDPSIQVIKIVRKSKFDLSITKRIRKVLIQNQIHNVFCVNTYAFFLTKLGFLFENSIRFFLSVHSTIPSSSKAYFQNFFYFRTLQKNDILIPICTYQKDYLNKKFFLKHDNQTIIYNGIDTKYFSADKNIKELSRVYKSNLQLHESDKVILIVARLHPEKGHLDALEALSVLHNELHTNAYLCIVGGGSDTFKQILIAKAEFLQIMPFVHIMGIYKDVRPFYHLSDVFTLTSWGTETFSLAALEAMSFGLPCSLTEIGGAKEMIVEGLNGELTKPKDVNSIALSWHKMLNTSYDSEKIREHVLSHFQLPYMLSHYESLISKQSL